MTTLAVEYTVDESDTWDSARIRNFNVETVTSAVILDILDELGTSTPFARFRMTRTDRDKTVAAGYWDNYTQS